MLSSAVAPELARRDAASQPTATPPPQLSTAPAAAPPLHHSHGSDEDQAAAVVLSMLGQRVAPPQRPSTPPPTLPPSAPLPPAAPRPPPASRPPTHPLPPSSPLLPSSPLPPPPPLPEPPPPFSWSACHNLTSTDGTGVPVRHPLPTACPAVKVQVKLQLPLLYSAERRTWLWHKKWRIPKLQVRASCNEKPVGAGLCPFPTQHNPSGAVGEPPVFVVVSAGTLCDASSGGVGLYHQGLSGDRQKRLIAGEAGFTSLLFQNTSFNCGNRPFHLVVSVLAPASHPLAARAAC